MRRDLGLSGWTVLLVVVGVSCPSSEGVFGGWTAMARYASG